MVLDAGSGFEGHGAAGAFVEHVAMSLLDVGLHRVQPPKHHQAAGTSAQSNAKEKHDWFGRAVVVFYEQ